MSAPDLLRLAVVCGGYSAEAAVSRKSAANVMEHLDRSRYAPTLVHIDRDGWWAEVDGERRAIDRAAFTVPGLPPFDGAFIIVHGTPGEDGRLQAYFELIGMPFTTGDARNMALTFHKGWTTGLLRAKGHPVAPSKEVPKGADVEAIDLESLLVGIGLPCFVKPNEAGSSVGVHRVDTLDQLRPAIAAALRAEDSSVLVEGFLNGREFTIGVLPDGRGGVEALPITEIISHNAFFDYQAKYEGASDEVTPAHLPDETREQMQDLAVAVYRDLDCAGMARIDMILVDGIPRIIEINTVPGFSAASIVPQQGAAIGLSKGDLLTRVVEATVGLAHKRRRAAPLDSPPQLNENK